MSAAFLLQMGFSFTPQQLFLLVALPNLVGSLLRLPYTFAVPKFGGRNWTMISAGLLLIPTLLFAFAVQDPTTPYWVFCLIAATAGFGGGNFASSMANINFFYPADRKGTALGLNAAGGNAGVAIIQLLLPVLVGGAGIFGLVQASDARHPPADRRVRVRRARGLSRRSRRTSGWTTSPARRRSRASSSPWCASRTPGSWRSSTSGRSARSSATPPRCRC